VASRTGPALPRALAAEARRQHGGHHRLLSAVLLDHEERRPERDQPVYLSLWLYIALPVFLAKDRRELSSFALGCAFMTCIALVVFWFMPTAIPNFTIDTSPGTSLHLLKTIDAAGNAFPSLHVSFSVFACVVLARQLRDVAAPMWLRLLNIAWAVGIVYSTMAVRQHVLIDVLGGLALGIGFGLASRPRQAVAAAAVQAEPA
jgi:membrane-associated phospholipid phosphatase